MKSYQKINNIVGWLVFFIALAVYTITVEDTASFWDCGEFIAVSNKLMIPHPPGAPFYLLVGRLASLFATSNDQIAFCINMVSVLSSAFTILFMFWSITLVGRKLLYVGYEDEPEFGQTLALMGAGIVGALAYTFSDSFWFSAVEAEVYAMSSFFTAIVVWLILKWEKQADHSGSDRILILTAYLIGLSIGVHLLNLLAFPAIALIIYFRKYENTNIAGGIVAFILGVIALGLVQVGVIVLLPSMAGGVEKLFVNSFHLPFNSGSLFFVVVFIGALSFGIYWSVVNKKRWLNTALLAFTFIVIGYSSYGIIIIRSQHNPPIDENNPEDVNSFVSYLKREQYGDRPLMSGPQYTARLTAIEQGDPLYRQGKDKDGNDVYQKYDYKQTYVWDKNSFMPRMHSRQHTRRYERLLNEYTNGRHVAGETPTDSENFEYMFKQQMGVMYFRYFLWNFVGRTGDEYGSEPVMVKEKLPKLLDSAANNQFFALPLLLGIFGLIFHIMRNQKSALILGILFFFTGLAIILYLNAPPDEPRERDYAYVGSFYVFSFWIGIGVLGFYDVLKNFLANANIRAVVSTGLCLIVPIIMGAEGWDDHDRSDRYHSVDSARNLLESCAPNAILFTGGDNDTFPLWYAQAVENIRPDVRVCNLSLLNTDWYIDAMKIKAYTSLGLPITLDKMDYIQGTNDQIRITPTGKFKTEALPLNAFMKGVRQHSRQVGSFEQKGDLETFNATLLGNKIEVETELDVIKNLDWIPAELKRFATSKMTWDLEGGAVYKKDLIILDMIDQIAQDGWKRPIYFSSTLGPDNKMGLDEYMMLEGMAYRLTPIKFPRGINSVGQAINTEVMYENMMKKFQYKGMQRDDVFYSYYYDNFIYNQRIKYFYLAKHLLDTGDKTRAAEVAQHCLTVMPAHIHIFQSPDIAMYLADILNEAGEKQAAADLVFELAKQYVEVKDYYEIKHGESEVANKKHWKKKFGEAKETLQGRILPTAARINDEQLNAQLKTLGLDMTKG